MNESKQRRLTNWLCVLVLSACYWFFISSAMRKPLWFDELFTWNIARLSPSRIWESLGQGVDLNPPLIYFATKISSSVFGDGNWGTRLPSVIAMWVIGLAIYAFVRHRASAWTAFAAALLPLVGGIYIWGAEARPYALMVASCALSFVFWQKVATTNYADANIEYSNEHLNDAVSNDATSRDNKAFWWPMLLALSLAMGVSSHYYAIFIWVPLLVGEAVRSVARRKIAWPVYAAFAMGLLPLMFYLPLIASSRPYMTTFWSKSAPREDIIQFYRAFLKPALLPFALTMAVFAVRTVLVALNNRTRAAQNLEAPQSSSPNAEPNAQNESRWVPRWEIAACATLALVPVMTTFFALITQRGYTLRYAAIGTIGCYLVLALLVSRGEKSWPHLGKVFAIAAVLGLFVTQHVQLQEANALSTQAMTDYPLLSSAATLEKSLPLVVGYPLRFMTAWHHGSPALRKRLLYLSDKGLSARTIGNDTNDRAMEALSHWSPIRVANFAEFTKKHRTFLFYDSGDGLRWLRPQTLRALGASTRLVRQQGKEALYVITWPVRIKSAPTKKPLAR